MFTVSVNVFVLISGYFLVSSKFKAKKVVRLWLEVAFYAVLTYGLYCILVSKSFSVESFIKCFFPITNMQAWFFSAYILVYLFSPFLNKILNNSSKKELNIMAIGLLVFVYIATRFRIREVSSIGVGYNVFWFVVLYLFGGYLRLNPPKIKKWIVFAIYVICTVALWGMSYMNNDSFLKSLIYNSLDYTSPLVLVASLCLILLFKDIKIKNKFIHKSICFVSSCTFGVYLFHCSYLEEFIFFKLFGIKNFYGSPYSALYVIAFALAVFAIGVVVDSIRQLIFWLIGLICKKIKSAKKKKSEPETATVEN